MFALNLFDHVADIQLSKTDNKEAKIEYDASPASRRCHDRPSLKSPHRTAGISPGPCAVVGLKTRELPSCTFAFGGCEFCLQGVLGTCCRCKLDYLDSHTLHRD
jgi:hypothetical protein